jgi:glycerophosphoryl diester phosphodiesterase
LALQCCAEVANYALWDSATVARVHSAGLKCLSYTVNDDWAAQHLLALGTDGIITDRVDGFSPIARPKPLNTAWTLILRGRCTR